MSFNYQNNYKIQLEEGQKFQDYCAYLLQKKLNIGVVNFQTKDWQYKLGENMQGIEFKFDSIFDSTGNLWIEIQERHDPDSPYVDSGILRQDNSWLYCIGNYDLFYIFSKKFLVSLYNSKRYEVRENKVKTSRGFLLPKSDAEKYSVNKINGISKEIQS